MGGPFGMLVFDQLEYRAQAGNDLFIWDVDGWYGGDFNRFWFRSEGAQILDGARSGDLEVHGYYSRLVAPFWDAQVGVRYDQEWEPGNRESRSFAAIGLEGKKKKIKKKKKKKNFGKKKKKKKKKK